LKEAVHQRTHMLITHQLALNRRQLSERIVRRVDGANAHQPLHTNGVPTDRRLEEIATAVRPTSNDFDRFT